MEIKTEIKDGTLLVEIPKEYLVNAFEMGVTTNCTGKVLDEESMLSYFATKFPSGEDDSHIGRCIDAICADALENEGFVEPDEY